jgi:hypothetical protein
VRFVQWLLSAVLVLLCVLMAKTKDAGDEVIVDGNPPLTRRLMDNFRQLHEWLLDIKLTAAQHRQWEGLFIAEFKKKPRFSQQQLVSSWEKQARYWEGLAKLDDSERARERAAQHAKLLPRLRKSTDQDDRLLVAVHDAEHRPGSRKNPILAAGDPPLTTALMEQRLLFVEWLFDLTLTPEQRAEYQRLFTKVWKELDKSSKVNLAKGIEMWGEASASWTAFHRNLARALYLPRALATGAGKDATEADRWLVALYETAYKPGGARNPVLVQGKLELTQALVDRYGDYLEWILQLSLSGGLTRAQRQLLQEYLVKDWKTMGASGRDEFLANIKKWAEVAPQGAKGWNRWRETLQPKLLAQLRSERDNPRSQFLLQLYAKEQQLLQSALQAERARHQITMNAMNAMGASAGPPPGYVEAYNQGTGRYEYRPK